MLNVQLSFFTPVLFTMSKSLSLHSYRQTATICSTYTNCWHVLPLATVSRCVSCHPHAFGVYMPSWANTSWVLYTNNFGTCAWDHWSPAQFPWGTGKYRSRLLYCVLYMSGRGLTPLERREPISWHIGELTVENWSEIDANLGHTQTYSKY